MLLIECTFLGPSSDLGVGPSALALIRTGLETDSTACGLCEAWGAGCREGQGRKRDLTLQVRKDRKEAAGRQEGVGRESGTGLAPQSPQKSRPSQGVARVRGWAHGMPCSEAGDRKLQGSRDPEWLNQSPHLARGPD